LLEATGGVLYQTVWTSSTIVRHTILSAECESVSKSVLVVILTYGQESWVMTKSELSNLRKWQSLDLCEILKSNTTSRQTAQL